MTEQICFLDAMEMAEKIRSKSLSPIEVMNAHLERIDKLNPKINAVVTISNKAKETALKAEEALMRGDLWGPLHGVPFTIKDCINTAGIRTTRGSKIFETFIPEADASVVDRLKKAGGILIGKTNMPEFAMWWESDNAVFGCTNNPWNLNVTPGGSSGGEAAAISSGMSPLGIGSDLGGSIRQPANYCNIVGIKATHGRIPLTGHWPETLLKAMHVGPMARSVRDIALALSIISGPDNIDHYAISLPPIQLLNEKDKLSQIRVGWSKEVGFSPVDLEVQKVVQDAAYTLQSLGCNVEEAPLDFLEENDPQAITWAVYTAEGREYFKQVIQGREEQLHSNMQKRLGIPMPSFDQYLQALDAWETIRLKTAEFFSRYDVLLCPSAPMPPYPHSQKEFLIQGIKTPGRHSLRATVPWDLTGSPAISVPFGWTSNGLPIGVQLVGRHLDEALLIKVASMIEETQMSVKKHPSL
jgi:aspartyl-tRNA(Asn)/glutamyl-tRNA(Gln) amidotransferase subunit A